MNSETIVAVTLLTAAFFGLVQLVRLQRYDNALYAFVLTVVLVGSVLAGIALLRGGVR